MGSPAYLQYGFVSLSCLPVLLMYSTSTMRESSLYSFSSWALTFGSICLKSSFTTEFVRTSTSPWASPFGAYWTTCAIINFLYRLRIERAPGLCCLKKPSFLNLMGQDLRAALLC